MLKFYGIKTDTDVRRPLTNYFSLGEIVAHVTPLHRGKYCVLGPWSGTHKMQEGAKGEMIVLRAESLTNNLNNVGSNTWALQDKISRIMFEIVMYEEIDATYWKNELISVLMAAVEANLVHTLKPDVFLYVGKQKRPNLKYYNKFNEVETQACINLKTFGVAYAFTSEFLNERQKQDIISWGDDFIETMYSFQDDINTLGDFDKRAIKLGVSDREAMKAKALMTWGVLTNHPTSMFDGLYYYEAMLNEINSDGQYNYFRFGTHKNRNLTKFSFNYGEMATIGFLVRLTGGANIIDKKNQNGSSLITGLRYTFDRLSSPEKFKKLHATQDLEMLRNNRMFNGTLSYTEYLNNLGILDEVAPRELFDKTRMLSHVPNTRVRKGFHDLNTFGYTTCWFGNRPISLR